MLNPHQLTAGIEGNTIIPSDCKALVTSNVMAYRADVDQQALCDNSCYDLLNSKYKIMLDNNCFDSTDEDAAANARMIAASYELACQTTTTGKYCIPMLANLVANAATDYDLCSDIVKDMGCCFQSYKQYMQIGTAASIKTMSAAQNQCVAAGISGIDKVCPCANNKHASNNTKICSEGAFTKLHLGAAVLAVAVLLISASTVS
ncbi:TPA: hypothetical protein N0F65_008949 [Lagenidium giganteum]|uniref:Uncharacterized protein n=1 Tax=Lagenidium giganteum TaxID=4803 RepID=A0AAV2Z0K4_9STRA|nr:TPA: hypothetical protein N0F65_008949 [Lagenidium giganteum]